MFFRKAVRDRFEATRCWQYEYDGLNPPPETSEHRSGTSIYDPNCDIMTSECSTPYGSAPVSLTEEEDREFWSLMRSAPADIPSLKSIKRASRLGDNISLSSGGYSSSHDELFNSPREVMYFLTARANRKSYVLLFFRRRFGVFFTICIW